jgi:CheY-like chemotaxis protein
MAKKILIVEDEKALNEAYKIVLSKEGYDVRTAFNGLEALSECKEHTFDLILLDLRMPKMDGIEFLKNFKPSKKAPNTKVIVFSNYDDRREVQEALKHGAERYIIKAWSSPSELVKIVRDSLSAEDSLE